MHKQIARGSPDDHDLPETIKRKKFLDDLQAVLDKTFEKYWLASSVDGYNMSSAGNATGFDMLTFAFDLLKKVETKYKKDGIYSLEHKMVDEVKEHLTQAIHHVRQLRVVSRQFYEIAEEHNEKEK